ncbi:MAG TPA: hypothetical protein VEP50_16895 [bacterium]|nr:hypothetical protein [bacterium]
MTCPACGSAAKPIITVAIARSTDAKPIWCPACHTYFDYRRWLKKDIERGTTLAIVVGTEASSKEPRRDVTVTLMVSHHDRYARRVDLTVTNVDVLNAKRAGWLWWDRPADARFVS